MDRFWNKVDVKGYDDCWNWLAYKKQTGYGLFRDESGKKTHAHRAAYEICNKCTVSSKLNVCHTCDNRSCVNPAHLYVGTQAQNMRDMVSRNRSNKLKGENHSQCKLTVAEVTRIRNRYSKGTVSQRHLAKEFNVTQTQIHYIVTHKQWKHLR